jgi:hypothetical protein
LARYGGGVSVAKIEDILNLPLTAVVRLLGFALVASGGKRTPGADRNKEQEAELLEILNAKARERGVNL